MNDKFKFLPISLSKNEGFHISFAALVKNKFLANQILKMYEKEIIFDIKLLFKTNFILYNERNCNLKLTLVTKISNDEI